MDNFLEALKSLQTQMDNIITVYESEIDELNEEQAAFFFNGMNNINTLVKLLEGTGE